MTPQRWIALKKYGYLLFVVPPALPWLAYAGALRFGFWDAWSLLVPAVYFVIIPLADLLIGKDPVNPGATEDGTLQHDRFYDLLLIACLPVWLLTMVFGAWVFAHAPFSTIGQLLWVASIGMVGGVTAINTGHELIHRLDPRLQWIGGVLLASVGYASFKIEHIYGHHVDVATPDDTSTARLGESVYHFVARAFAHNLPRAFALEREVAARHGRTRRGFASGLAAWYGLTALLGAAFAFAWGWTGALYYVGQCIAAIVMLEIVNYLEHYGLARARHGNGQYERVNPTHSWNSNYLLTNWMLFQLQRHADHHALAVRPYQALRHIDDSPQLPFGYATMVVLALVPPLWRRVMDPRVAAYRARDARGR